MSFHELKLIEINWKWIEMNENVNWKKLVNKFICSFNHECICVNKYLLLNSFIEYK
jgi:hypothetical protein